MASRTERPTGPARRSELGDGPLTMAVSVDLGDALARLGDLGSRFTALVRAIARPGDRTHGLEWTLAETAAHVLQTYRYYESAGRGEVVADIEPNESIPGHVARKNVEEIAAEPERDPGRLADGIDAAVEHFIAWAKEAGPDRVASFSSGYSMDLPTTVCTLIGELVMHGYDIARTLDRPWKVDPKDAVLAVYATTAALPLAFDEDAASGVGAHAEVRLRGAVPFSIRIEDGRVWSESPGVGRPDVRLSADPMSYLLVGFGRSGLWPLAARGKLLAWGRKPWVMAQLPRYFQRP
jgi:uncharacterized protein (TIGR03083 family)